MSGIKFENGKEGQTLKRLLDRTLYKNTGMNLCLFVMLKAF